MTTPTGSPRRGEKGVNMRSFTLPCVVLLIASAGPIMASSPGQPYECADWEILAPGVSCSQVGAWSEQRIYGADVAVDNRGHLPRGQEAAYRLSLRTSTRGCGPWWRSRGAGPGPAGETRGPRVVPPPSACLANSRARGRAPTRMPVASTFLGAKRTPVSTGATRAGGTKRRSSPSTALPRPSSCSKPTSRRRSSRSECRRPDWVGGSLTRLGTLAPITSRRPAAPLRLSALFPRSRPSGTTDTLARPATGTGYWYLTSGPTRARRARAGVR